MKAEFNKVTIRDLVENYSDCQEEGVQGYFGDLNIRPAYQREFVYSVTQQEAVIHTVLKGLPLNTMYWAQNDNGYEVIDGQQRTMSICRFVTGEFALDYKYFHNLPKETQDKILDYELFVYFCSGTTCEKLAWFETINVAGEKLTKQELLNATYVGSYLADAKKYFSKTGCQASNIGSKYVKGSPIRQEYLETVLKWVSEGNIKSYLATHQHDHSAVELWEYFQSVIDWTQAQFPNYRKEMKGVDWGKLYGVYGKTFNNPTHLEAQIQSLMQDVDVTKKAGIYEYVLTGNLRVLSVRAFDARIKREVFEAQKGVCPHCKGSFVIGEMEADHITPWHEGGKTITDNCQMLCKGCNRTKGGK